MYSTQRSRRHKGHICYAAPTFLLHFLHCLTQKGNQLRQIETRNKYSGIPGIAPCAGRPTDHAHADTNATYE